jgi:hypothetical protein
LKTGLQKADGIRREEGDLDRYIKIARDATWQSDMKWSRLLRLVCWLPEVQESNQRDIVTPHRARPSVKETTQSEDKARSYRGRLGVNGAIVNTSHSTTFISGRGPKRGGIVYDNAHIEALSTAMAQHNTTPACPEGLRGGAPRQEGGAYGILLALPGRIGRIRISQVFESMH